MLSPTPCFHNFPKQESWGAAKNCQNIRFASWMENLQGCQVWLWGTILQEILQLQAVGAPAREPPEICGGSRENSQL